MSAVRHGEATVDEYGDRFQKECGKPRLSIDTENSPNKFVKGLRPSLQQEVLMHQPVSLADCLSRARIAETATNASREIASDKMQKELNSMRKELAELRNKPTINAVEIASALAANPGLSHQVNSIFEF